MCHRWEFEVDCLSQADQKKMGHIGFIWHERFFDFLARSPLLAKTMKAGHKASHMRGRM